MNDRAVVVMVVQLVTAYIVAGALCTGDISFSELNGLTPRLTSAPIVWGAACTTACVVLILILMLHTAHIMLVCIVLTRSHTYIIRCTYVYIGIIFRHTVQIYRSRYHELKRTKYETCNF